MLMEFLQGGDLISILIERKRLTEAETRFYFAQLLEALDYIHSLGFVHRDIKPDNICFSRQGHLKLLDFGLCKEVMKLDQFLESVGADASKGGPAGLGKKVMDDSGRRDILRFFLVFSCWCCHRRFTT